MCKPCRTCDSRRGEHASRPVLQYDELSPNAKRAFDQAQSADGSVIVYGEQCSAEFSYTADQNQYEIVTDDSRYLLTTYANDLLPEVPITLIKPWIVRLHMELDSEWDGIFPFKGLDGEQVSEFDKRPSTAT